MNERPVSPSDRTIADQRRAAAPNTSAWVQANAGAGKTHVLTERVLRLLLSGVAPENILCLTYTKAAAANMRARVSQRLGEWALMDEAQLFEVLKNLENTAPDAARMARARTLFAHALETPGGLKINTIHAFCEAVLHRFPLEAKVPFDFTVIEDAERAELVRQAREEVLAEGLAPEITSSKAVETLFALLSDAQIESAISTALAEGRALRPLLADTQGAKQRLRALVGLKQPLGYKTLEAEIIEKTYITSGIMDAIGSAFLPDPENGRRFVDALARFDPSAPDLSALMSAFFTGKGEPRKTLLAKKDAANFPHLAAAIENEMDRLISLREAHKAELLIARSDALLDVLGAIVGRYEASKRARARLDFDDLIERLATLFENPDAMDWVRYKLDAGITHVLVDESQDTNPEQWRVIRKITEEFFAGDGAVTRERTLFAVGDQKQSIFSFQGAEPRLFVETGREMARRARDAAARWEDVPLRASFRTQSNVLKAVDLVFEDPMRAKAVLESEGVLHESARSDPGGSVTLLPVFEADEVTVSQDWPLPDDVRPTQSAERKLALYIAGMIRQWIDEKRPLGPRGRAVTADDIMILVQSRGSVFVEIIRALKELGVQSPGADKLPVSSHIAVADLLALADVLLNTRDDLNLAAVLRSPLFDISEEALFEICHGRRNVVWNALAESDLPEAKEAFERLQKWRSRLDFGRPYDFFAHILYAQGGLKRFHARLGTEVDEVLAEFLDLALAHEREVDLSLQSFIAAMRQSDISISRDLPEKGNGVRVMTVHGAKGLEAPIVFMADTTAKPGANSLGKPVYIEQAHGGSVFVHAGNREAHLEQTLALREASEANQLEEYWRKLYVGMTRAEDELYVTGTLDRRKGERAKKLEGSWYEAVELSLANKSLELTRPDTPEGERILRFPVDLPGDKPASATADIAATTTQEFDFSPVPPALSRTTVRPSIEGHEAVDDAPVQRDNSGDNPLATSAETLRDADLARRQGIALHALLQHLATLPDDVRHSVGLRAMEALLPEAPERHQPLIDKASAILARPDLAEIFGPRSRAEMPILAHGQKGKEDIRIVGRIDRLLVTNEKVLIVDFKSDANPPLPDGPQPAPYVAQLGLYALVMKKLFPDLKIEAALFWTTTEKLVSIPQSALEATSGSYTLT